MTTPPEPGGWSTPGPARIAAMQQVTAMCALDSIDFLADRVERLLAHGRRMTLVGRWIDSEATPTVETGLTVRGKLERHRTTGGIVVTAHLHPSLAHTFGFSASDGVDDTEAQAWEQYHHTSGDRQQLTQVTISGGLPGNGPATTDQIVIRHWNSYNRCWETIVAFDTGGEQ